MTEAAEAEQKLPQQQLALVGQESCSSAVAAGRGEMTSPDELYYVNNNNSL